MLVKSMGVSRHCCASYSLEAVSLILNSAFQFHCYFVVVSRIRDLMREDGEVSIKHTLREDNMCIEFFGLRGGALE